MSSYAVSASNEDESGHLLMTESNNENKAAPAFAILIWDRVDT